MKIVQTTARTLLTGFSFIFLGLFALIVVYVGLDPAQHKFKLFEAPIPLLMGACALVSLLFFVTEKGRLGHRTRRFAPYVIPAMLVVSMAAQLLVAYALRSSGYAWDSDLILQQAIHYAVNGEIEPAFAPYMANNPNNIGLLAGLGAIFRLLHHFGIEDYLTAATVINVVTMWAAQLFTFLTVKLLYGRRIAAVSLGFTFIFISLSMYVQIPYTDTLGVVFPVLLCYLALRWVRAKSLAAKTGSALLIGLFGTIGYLIKPTVAIALAAIALAGVSALMMHGRRREAAGRPAWVAPMMGIAAGVIMAWVVFGMYQKGVDRLHIIPFPVASSSQTAKPPLYFYAMGLKTTTYDNTVVYGGYSETDSEAVAKRLSTQDKQAFARQLAHERLAAYGPAGYSVFLMHKANWVLSDATFYAYGEGSNEQVIFRSSDPLSRWIRSFMYIEGPWYVLFGNILQVFWLALLILIASPLMLLAANPAARLRIEEALPRLMIAGIILFLLLFEARSRYLFLYVPVFIVAAMSALKWFAKPAPGGDAERILV